MIFIPVAKFRLLFNKAMASHSSQSLIDDESEDEE
jgi:hypothetical protein